MRLGVIEGKRMFNKRLTRMLDGGLSTNRPAGDKKRAAEGGSQEFNREASNEVAPNHSVRIQMTGCA
jgi:hypothetical protein